MYRVRSIEIWKLESPVGFSMTTGIDSTHKHLISECKVMIKRELNKTGVREAQKIIVTRREVLIEAVSGERRS